VSLFRPENASALFLAADRASGEWIGFTRLNYSADPRYTHQAMTGVRRAYRRRKIALALKILGIQQARTRGVAEIETGNDSRNAAMLASNHKLGFVPGRGQHSLIKRFSP
jgi:predicted GNAT superfamily acetyltransferase